jgi:hypothetical protein
MADDPTIRTRATRVLQDHDAPEALRELALVALHWRLRDRFAASDTDDTTIRITRPVLDS